MLDPGQPKACFQGRDFPREGGGNQVQSKEERLGDLCLAVGNVGDALGYFMAGLAGVAEGDAETRLGLALKISACHRRQGTSEEALALLEGLAPALKGRQRRDLLAEKATVLCLVGRYGEAAKVCEEVQLGESASERGKDAGVYLVLGHVLSRLCRWREAIVCLEQAATFARMGGDLTALGNALNNLGIVYKNLCKFEDARRCLARAVGVARRSHDDASLAVRLLNLGTTLLKQGDVGAADRAVSECLEISSQLSLTRTRTLATICRARLEEARGNLDTARDILRQVLSAADGIDEPRLALLVKETLGDVLRRSGEAAEARGVLEACLAEVGPESKDIECEVKSRLSETYLALGMRGPARQLACEAMRTAQAIGDVYEAARSMRVLGAVCADRAESLRWLGKAERAFKAMGARLECGRTVFARATLEGTAPAAIHDLELAAEIFEASLAVDRRVRVLCALARVRLAAGEPERALEHVRDADGLKAGSPVLGKLVSQTRAEIDAHVSEHLRRPIRERVVSCEAAFSMLRARFNAAGLIIGRMAGQDAEVVKAFGVEHGTAKRLVRAFSAKDRSPVVSTDIAELLPGAGKSSGLRSLVGFRLDEAEPGVICLICWQGGKPPAGSQGSEISRLAGAFQEISTLAPVLGTAIASGRRAIVPICLTGLLTADPRMKEILLSLPRIAATRANVLIMGETGTGKELVAQGIHMLSPRRKCPLVVQNCAALPEQLLESELFGHRAGAFTDARADKRGLLEAASGGSFFLDEIGDVSVAIQAKMLRAIESGQLRRLGDTQTRSIDVRFISATNKDLEHEVEKGRFRRDLYYRLNVVSLALPPLRERRDDIMLLAKYFLARSASNAGRPAIEIDESAHRALVADAWPGNVRQLENEIERAVAMLGRREVLTADLLSPRITGGEGTVLRPTLRDEVRAVERVRILSVLEKCGWNKTHAARALGDISRPALLSKMKRLGIPAANPRGSRAGTNSRSAREA